MAQGCDIEISNLKKHYTRRDGSSVRAIDDITLRIEAGEFVVLLGPSGCGKTTLLRCLAGLETPESGSIRVGDRVVFDGSSDVFVPPERRQIGMMFQSYALWPHMTIHENVRFPLKMRSVDRTAAASKIERVLEMMRIKELAQQYPGQLSGGQQQRVALARAMVCSESLILFDEPLSNVDAKVREHLRTELAVMQRQLGFTAIYVTHDQDEAMALADRIVVLGNGRILQSGAPREVYARPVDVQVADFVGLANFIAGQVTRREGAVRVRTALGEIEVSEQQAMGRDGEVVVMSRPEHWTLRQSPHADGGWKGRVRLVTHLGPHTDYIVAIDEQNIRVRDHGVQRAAIGDEVWCSTDRRELVLLQPDMAAGVS